MVRQHLMSKPECIVVKVASHWAQIYCWDFVHCRRESGGISLTGLNKDKQKCHLISILSWVNQFLKYQKRGHPAQPVGETAKIAQNIRWQLTNRLIHYIYYV